MAADPTRDESQSSSADGSTSTCELGGQHQWQMMSVTQGDIWGADSLGRPVFVPLETEPVGVAFGCGECGEPWLPAPSKSLS